MTERGAAGPTVDEARRRFFAANDFGADGGYEDAWADAELGAFAYRVPNLRARSDALRVHDLHHLVTGYATDWRGEAQISAWELGAGWGRYPYAWFIALLGLLTGVVALPWATLRAFARGRRSRGNLYGFSSVEPWLDLPLTALRQALGVPPPPSRVRAADVLAFVPLVALAALLGVAALPALTVGLALGEGRRALRAAGCPACGGVTA